MGHEDLCKVESRLRFEDIVKLERGPTAGERKRLLDAKVPGIPVTLTRLIAEVGSFGLKNAGPE